MNDTIKGMTLDKKVVMVKIHTSIHITIFVISESVIGVN